jgi:hypothetical protein
MEDALCNLALLVPFLAFETICICPAIVFVGCSAQ